jgi:hypothetical protein
MGFLSSRGSIGLALLAASLSGCLPSSCRRTEPRELFPADSTSRAVAATVPVDTLEALGTIRSRPDAEFRYPRTIAYGPAGRLWLADTEMHRLLAFSSGESPGDVIETGEESYPYIAGFRGDTVLVFSPPAREIVAFGGGRRVPFLALGSEPLDRSTLQYAAVTPEHAFFKVISENAEGYVIRVNDAGFETHRWNLAGEYWRYAGLLRTWGDSLLSLSGYRPIVHLIRDVSPVDTLDLVGFDSPMLARSRRFVLGELKEPPLLSASAAAAGPLLFVLNMRPGWLRVDAYDHDGRIRRVLTQASPAFGQNYYPTDIAVRRLDDGTFGLGNRPDDFRKCYR